MDRSRTVIRRGGRAALRCGLAGVLTFAAFSGGTVPGQATKAKPEPAPPAATGQLAPEVLRRVKDATVHLKVTLPEGSAEGSGFFAGERGIVLTNAHVLSMFKADSRRPKKIDVVIHSGERDERTVPAQVLGVDTNSDLAVLRTTTANLPTPLEVSAASDLLETQVVYVFGFPFGSSLGKAITVNTSSVSSLRRNNAGVLQRVQVNGGMNPGNSGGPVVDAQGRVIGVAVSVIGRTQINFAVPGEAVRVMLAGKIQEVTMGHPYKDGTSAKSTMELKLIDPLNKIGKVSLLVWSGPTAKTRAEAPPPPPAGDPKRQEAVDLPVKRGVASVLLTLPAVVERETYWVQPSYTDSAGKAQKWLPIMWPVKIPVERTPVVLALKPKPQSKNDLEMISNTTFVLRDAEGEEHTLAVNMKTNMVETIAEVDSQGIAAIHLKYSRITMGMKLDNQPTPLDKQMKSMMPDLFKVGADLRVDSQGTLIENKLDMSAVPPKSRGLVLGIASKIQKSFEAIELSLPGKSTTANVPWTGRRDLPIDTPSDDEQGQIDMNYFYLGHHQRNNVDEALVEMKGVVKGRKGDGLNLGGRVQGLAFVDVDHGQVTQINVTTYLDMDLQLGGRPGKANGKLEVKLARKPAAPAGAAKAKGVAATPK